jgi:hypothetical protein
MSKTFQLPIFAIIAMFLVVSCSTTQDDNANKQAGIMKNRQTDSSHEAPSDHEKYKDPFFEEQEMDSYYENEDEDDGRFFEWFINGIKGFWEIVTYPGRAFD